MSTDDIATRRARHQPSDTWRAGSLTCSRCVGRSWPCDAEVLGAALEESQQGRQAALEQAELADVTVFELQLVLKQERQAAEARMTELSAHLNETWQITAGENIERDKLTYRAEQAEARADRFAAALARIATAPNGYEWRAREDARAAFAAEATDAG